jgi:malyl-CoA/(S)-citramalyl-CoA lyase
MSRALAARIAGASARIRRAASSSARFLAAVAAVRFSPLGRRSVTGGDPYFDFAAVPPAQALPAVDAATLLACMIETREGVANVEAIAQASKRLEAMSFGVADYAASTRARTTVIGGVNRDSGVLTDRDADGNREYFWTDPWHAAQTRMMVACRAYGLRPIDGPFGDFNDPDGFVAAANRAAVLGYEGKWAIHPSQIALANQVYTPSDAEVSRARRIMQAMDEAAKAGKGAVSLDGRMIDIASIRMAEALLVKAEQIGGQGK